MYSPNRNVQEMLGIKTQILKMTVTRQKRWKQRRKLQKKNTWIGVAIAVCFYLLALPLKLALVLLAEADPKRVPQGWTSHLNYLAISIKELYKELQSICGKILDPPLVCELFTLLQYKTLSMAPTKNDCLKKNYSSSYFSLQALRF